MTKQEFIDRTGMKNISDSDFNIANNLYMECGNMDKDQFCAEYKKQHCPQILATYYLQHMNEKKEIAQLNDERKELVSFLIDRAQAMGDIECFKKAAQMVGMAEAIKIHIKKGYDLWQIHKDWIIENI